MNINVAMGDYIIASGEDVLYTFGVGSCLAICLYEPISKTGALFHAVLPSYENNKRVTDFLKYVDSGLFILLSDFYKVIDSNAVVEASLIGGANLYKKTDFNIGNSNINICKRILDEENISINNEDTGGDFGRNVEFSLSTGKIYVRTLKKGNYMLK